MAGGRPPAGAPQPQQPQQPPPPSASAPPPGAATYPAAAPYPPAYSMAHPHVLPLYGAPPATYAAGYMPYAGATAARPGAPLYVSQHPSHPQHPPHPQHPQHPASHPARPTHAVMPPNAVPPSHGAGHSPSRRPPLGGDRSRPQQWQAMWAPQHSPSAHMPPQLPQQPPPAPPVPLADAPAGSAPPPRSPSGGVKPDDGGGRGYPTAEQASKGIGVPLVPSHAAMTAEALARKAGPATKPAGKPVKMTELLQAVGARLSENGEHVKAQKIAATGNGYRQGEMTYQTAMNTMTEVVGREILIQEVCRLSQIVNRGADGEASTNSSAASANAPAPAGTDRAAAGGEGSEPAPAADSAAAAGAGAASAAASAAAAAAAGPGSMAAAGQADSACPSGGGAQPQQQGMKWQCCQAYAPTAIDSAPQGAQWQTCQGYAGPPSSSAPPPPPAAMGAPALSGASKPADADAAASLQ